MTKRGFPNIGLVREALGVLVPAIKKGKLPPPTTAPWEGYRDFPVDDPVIGVQHLARRIAGAYLLHVGTVIVTFTEKLKAAGRVECSGRRDAFFVELRAEYCANPRVMAAILGHEVAHIFLHHNGVHLSSGLAEEILTDAAAVLYGFGALMADTYRVTHQTEELGYATRVTRTEQHMGYLTPDEMGYVLTRSGFGAIDEKLESDVARQALAVGRDFAKRELTAPPLRCASWGRRALYRAKRWWAERWRHSPELEPLDVYRLQSNKVLFRCTMCCQSLRLPTHARIIATCPRCEMSLPCDT